MRTSRAAALFAGCALTLSACAWSSQPMTSTVSAATPDSISSVAPATGPTITGSTYTYSAPSGWAARSVPGMSPDSSAFETHPTGGFAEGINVITDPSAGPSNTLDQYQAGALIGLERVGAQDVQADGRVTIDGDPAIHVSSMMSINTHQYGLESFAVKHNGRWWVISITSRSDVPPAQRWTVAFSILRTWQWTDSTSSQS